MYAGIGQLGIKSQKFKFSFEKKILILDIPEKGKYKTYYNIDKLISFYIRDNRMIFIFENTYAP